MLPEHLKIGYEVYRVSVGPSIENDGECDHAAGRILVDGSLTPRRRAATLIHEVVHACWDQAVLPSGDADLAGLKEEDIVARLASVLAQVLMDNPQLRECMSIAGENANSTGWRSWKRPKTAMPEMPFDELLAFVKRTQNTAPALSDNEPRSEPCSMCGTFAVCSGPPLCPKKQ